MIQLNTKITDEQAEKLNSLPDYIRKSDFIRTIFDMAFDYIDNAENEVMGIHRIMSRSVFITGLFSQNPKDTTERDD